MIHSVECLSKVQEEHSTDTALINLVKDIGQKVNEAGMGIVTIVIVVVVVVVVVVILL